MKNRIVIFNHSVLEAWSVHFNGQQKHHGKNNPASLRYREKCVEKLKKLSLEVFPNWEVEIVEMNF